MSEVIGGTNCFVKSKYYRRSLFYEIVAKIDHIPNSDSPKLNTQKLH